ncbi:pentatricopeptide repeat-containing protein At1g11290, chloroplastic [Cryptomeria japonica]|uniref:pentatricopeptide repeat-containing protein At1g11290, chloroplastic n=1 Tax=Cryptomeria japonica TaxID=3369 RepID=UPI0025AC7463|nr:pentatricopeptide repeat-containing protein At1g11290, chloroplastic [Cryptomeria japonica]
MVNKGSKKKKKRASMACNAATPVFPVTVSTLVCATCCKYKLGKPKMRCRFFHMYSVPPKEQKPDGVSCNGLGIYDSNHYACLLQTLIDKRDLRQGNLLHAHFIITGIIKDNSFYGLKLATMYALSGSMEDARQLFDKMPQRSASLWNVMIRGYACNGQGEETLRLYYQMQDTGVQPDRYTFPFVLKACAALLDLQRGRDIHRDIVRFRLQSDAYVGTALVDMYGKCGSIEDARELFDKMPKTGITSWNAMIAGYTQNGFAEEALELFLRMQQSKVMPNVITIVSVLPACAHLGDPQQVKDIHDYVVINGFDSDVSVGNSLVAMYAKCGDIETARNIFDKMCKRTVVSWNAMVAGYQQNGYSNEALNLFHEMQASNVIPNRVTVVSVLPACADMGDLQLGKDIHENIVRDRFDSDANVLCSLIAMYSKCGSVEVARQIFDSMSTRDVVIWNAMIAGYTQSGHANEALRVFCQMRVANIKSDSITMLGVIPACAQSAALQQGKVMHAYIMRSGFELGVAVGTALIDMYAKCGRIRVARQLFDKMPKRNLITWSTMIAGYGTHGQGEDALALFQNMQQTSIKPDHITFTSVLCACSYAGLVDEGWQFFESMTRDYSIAPRLCHYGCMVDLLGRAGYLNEAHDFIEAMPVKPNASVWGSLLSACRIHGNIELGEKVAEHLFDLDPEDAGNYVLLFNIYAAAGKWDDAAKVRTAMKDRGLKKTPGSTLIEVNNKIHAFVVGDTRHPQSDQIYEMLEILERRMEDAGYVPDTKFILHNVEEEAKEHMLSVHSEKLAIAFGIISTRPGMPIQITKNLRVCGDCHTATKFISKIVRREIIVRDANRFHHFKDGICSCSDYW